MAEHTHHHDVVGHTSADDQYLATPPGSQYEHTDASVWIIVKLMMWLVIAAVVIHVGMAVLFDLFVTQRVETGDPRYPLATTDSGRLPPEPRLQRFPREDLMNYRLGEEAILQHYGWIDREAGTVHIPITDAMRLVLERQRLRVRAQGSEAAEGQAPALGLMPADSSSGRTMERRRQ